MGNILSASRRSEVLALGQLGWTLRRIGTSHRQALRHVIQGTVVCRFSRKHGRPLSNFAPTRDETWRMIRRRAVAAGINVKINNHTMRATGITAFLEAGGGIEDAQQIAAHESPRTTKLYDRTNDTLSLDEIEIIQI